MPEQRMIKDGQVVANSWQLLGKETTELPAGNHLILPLALWLALESTLATRNDIAVWFDSEELPDAAWADKLKKLPLIAIHFPIFTDGRGFSIARLLRERFGYRGEVRAFGHVLREQMCYMKRCGFSSFILAEHINLEEAVESLNDFTEYYQCSVDQPQPLFRRM